MIILIPTLGRVHNQHTLSLIPKDWLSSVWLVVSEEEAPLHKALGRQVVVCPMQGAQNCTLSDVLQWCIEQDYGIKTNKILFMDDDLKICHRKAKGDWKLEYNTPDDPNTGDLFWEILRKLDQYPMVGVAARQGFNRLPEGFKLATRQCQVHGINLRYFMENKIRYDNFPIKQDFDVTLQVLRSGQPNCLLTDWAIDSVGGSGAKGGCSTYRDDDMLRQVAHQLAEKHKPFVKVVEKTTKGAWGGKTRTDVIIYWKKALEYGKSNS